MNLNQNPHTLLPKFFGMYTYQCNQKNIRVTIMNNLLPSNIKMHLKFDLKGSTFKRKVRLFDNHTTYTRNNMGQKCGGNSGLWVLNEMIKKDTLKI